MKRAILILLGCILVITGCVPATPYAVAVETQTPFRTPTLTRTPKPTKTPFPTKTSTVTPTLSLTPSPTSTIQPPLTEHEWDPEMILIMLRDNLGDGGIDLGDLGSPPFVLYADGSLYIRHATEISIDNYQIRALVKKLSRNEICQHLNTLDQIGYIDYDPSNYTYINSDRPFVIGASETFITTNAWKSKSSKYYGLSTALEDYILKDYYGQKGYPVIASSLRNTYYFLSNYPADGFEIYKPDRLAVWIFSFTGAPTEYMSPPEKWKLNTLSLSELLERAKPLPNFDYESFVTLTGKEARSMYAYFGEEDSSRNFEVDNADGSKTYYAVRVRPLLPYEMLGEYYMSEFPNLPKPDFKLHCYPSDGTLTIPIPSYP